jgi:outer membrane protein OmpA-like peptidoglycan-associated protein
MVAYRDIVPDIDALDRADARIVATPSSPSETLGRVVLDKFSLEQLPDDPFIAENGAEAVYRRLISADRSSPRAYVLWEPFVSKALEEPGVEVIMDSSRFRGYIVDVLVVQRAYLIDNEQQIDKVLRSYFRTLYEIARDDASRQQLVREDARRGGEQLTAQQAERLASGIWWKNTQENYAHFGLLGGRATLPGFGTMVPNIADVLIATGGIAADPTGGEPGRVYAAAPLRRLQEDQFHPGLGGVDEPIRDAATLVELTDEQWDQLVPVGTLAVERLVFARGTARLTRQSEHALRELASTLDSFPQYYLVINGHARREGDPEANRRIAGERAESARAMLASLGVPAARLRTVALDPQGTNGRNQTVSFVLGQLPY